MEDSGQFCPGHFSPALESRSLFNRRLGGLGFVVEDSKMKNISFSCSHFNPGRSSPWPCRCADCSIQVLPYEVSLRKDRIF